MKSKIVLQEEVMNKDRKFGSSLVYFPCHIEDKSGNITNALFTQDQISDAIERGLSNPEDMPRKSLWEAMMGE